MPDSPTRVVILGGGFGGIYAALELEKVLARRPDLEPPQAGAA
jgi:NADH dehydrogenase FAD-containing subunit